MKKLIALLLALAMVFTLVACATTGTTPATDTAATNPTAEDTPAENTAEPADNKDDSEIVVAGIVFHDDQFMNMLTKGYVDAAADAGVTCLTDHTNSDQAREAELINTYLGQGVDGLAIAPLNEETSAATLRAASEQGMMVAVTNINLSDADFIVAGYTSDDYSNSHMTGVEAADILKQTYGDETVKIGIVQYKSLMPEQSGARVNGFLDALTENDVKYEIVADQDAWASDTSVETASAMLTAHPEIQVFLATNALNTVGCALVVESAGRSEDIMVFGYDGTDQISEMILDDSCPLVAAAAQDPYAQGYNAMTALINAIKGDDYSATKGKCEIVPGILLTSRDKDFVNEWRVDNGYEAIN